MSVKNKIVDAAHVAVINAHLQPDPRLGGRADCYFVPIQDIEDLRKLLEEMGRKTT